MCVYTKLVLVAKTNEHPSTIDQRPEDMSREAAEVFGCLEAKRGEIRSV